MSRPHTTIIAVLMLLAAATAAAQSLSDRYNAGRPVTVVCDWEKPPYEFLDDNGRPAGSNVDVINVVMRQLGLPCRFVMKEWNVALKTFERGDADLILANGGRYRNGSYTVSQNIVNYNRIRVATCSDTSHVVPLQRLQREGAVFKPGDYSALYFTDGDSTSIAYMDFQTPKVALTGLLAGDYKYFVWGEEPLRWKIHELNLDGIRLADVNIPVSEIHIIGRDRELVEAIDDQYSRMKQSGDVEEIQTRWFHPERSTSRSTPLTLLLIFGTLLLAALCYLFNYIARARVRKATRSSSELNEMMARALHMGNFDVMEYDIRRDIMRNTYGNILPAEGLTLEAFTARIHPEQRDEFREKMRRLIEGRERHFELDKRWNAGSDAEPHWLNFQGHAIVEAGSDGRPAYIVNAVHDVTSDVEEGNAAFVVKQKYECLSNLPLLAMSFYDKDGWLKDTNQEMRRICHFDADNGDAERFWTQMCMFDVPLFRGVYSQASRDSLFVCQHMDYPEIGVDSHIEFSISPLFGADGDVAYYFVTTSDITDDRLRHQQLRRINNEIRQTRDDIQRLRARLHYLLRESDRHLVRADNATRKFSFYRTLDAPEFVHDYDHFIDDMLVEADRQPVRDFVRDTQTRASRCYTIHLRQHSEGQPGTVFDISFAPDIDAQGNIVGHSGVSRDITRITQAREELRRVAEQAKDSGRMKSGFMASMTHELRTPLNAIVGFAGILEMLDEGEERAEYVRIIRNSSEMLQRLINDIIEASSFTGGPTTIEPQRVNFASAFEDMCTTLHARMNNPNITCIKDNPYTSYYTTLDIGRIQQVLTNFVINAAKFTERGHIRLGYREKDGGIYFYCEDTGRGIPKDKQAIVFDRFVKLDEFVQGTGMGLAICKSLATAMGGQIGVESEGEGMGSTFWMWVPASENAK